MSDYATTDEIAAFAQEAPVTEALEVLASAASRLFDKLCGVEDGFFTVAGDFSLKTFYGDGTAYLSLPPYTELNATPVVIYNDDDDEQELPDYFEQNGHLIIKGYGAGVPTTDPSTVNSPWPSDRVLVDRATNFVGWPVNYRITVSAKWGFEEIPADVKQAVIGLAIHLWRTSDPAFTAISQSGQPYAPPGVPKQVQTIADQYRALYNQRAVFA